MIQNAISYESAYPVVKETIPRSKLGYSCNAVYDGFPPLMSDGRSIMASYQSTSTVDKYLQEKGDFTDWQYRQYLQKNGQKVMRDNFREASNDCGYFHRLNQPKPNGLGNQIHSLYANQLDRAFPIGNGENSDLKQIYLTRAQLYDLDERSTSP